MLSSGWNYYDDGFYLVRFEDGTFCDMVREFLQAIRVDRRVLRTCIRMIVSTMWEFVHP